MSAREKPASPLAHLAGEKPLAPRWFADALANAPERNFHDVQGAAIESLAWGRRGDPGLLLMHGNGAHADWYSFIGPLLAKEHRVVALSWSGMGGSGWRESYSLDLYVEEALTVAAAEGLFEAPAKPVFVGHSFGSFPTLACAARAGERLRAAVVVDLPMFSKEQREREREGREPSAEGGSRRGPPPPRVPRPYATLEEALARFRFQPPQSCEHLYVVDHIARTSLKPLDGHGEGAGWIWKFAPNLFQGYRMSNPVKDIAAARCPVAVVRGERSKLVNAEAFAYAKTVSPPGTPFVEIPDADHHVMVDQPLAFVGVLRALTAGWP